jgi:hypothetical protein
VSFQSLQSHPQTEKFNLEEEAEEISERRSLLAMAVELGRDERG